MLTELLNEFLAGASRNDAEVQLARPARFDDVRPGWMGRVAHPSAGVPRKAPGSPGAGSCGWVCQCMAAPTDSSTTSQSSGFQPSAEPTTVEVHRLDGSAGVVSLEHPAQIDAVAVDATGDSCGVRLPR